LTLVLPSALFPQSPGLSGTPQVKSFRALSIHFL
jgi:hypothetical protein